MLARARSDLPAGPSRANASNPAPAPVVFSSEAQRSSAMQRIAPIRLSFTFASATAVRCPARHEARSCGTHEYRRAFSQAWDQPLEHIIGAESCAWCDLYSLSPDVAQLHPSLLWCTFHPDTVDPGAEASGFFSSPTSPSWPSPDVSEVFFRLPLAETFLFCIQLCLGRPRSLRRGSKPRSVLSFFPIERQDATHQKLAWERNVPHPAAATSACRLLSSFVVPRLFSSLEAGSCVSYKANCSSFCGASPPPCGAVAQRFVPTVSDRTGC